MAFSDPYEQWKAQGRPGGSFSAWQGGQQPAQQAIPAPPQAQPVQGGIPSVADVRAGTTNASEDFARFNDATIQGWNSQFYDAAASKAAGRPQYRSMRGAPGFYDKPTECPPGQGPSGGNESDPCTAVGYGGGDGGQAGLQQGQQSANPWAAPQQQPGAPQMPAMPQAPAPVLGTYGSGITGQGSAGLPQALAPHQGLAGVQGATQGLLQQTMAQKQAAPGSSASLGSGWSAGADGLTQMLAKQQRKPGVAGTGQWWG